MLGSRLYFVWVFKYNVLLFIFPKNPENTIYVVFSESVPSDKIIMMCIKYSGIVF